MIVLELTSRVLILRLTSLVDKDFLSVSILETWVTNSRYQIDPVLEYSTKNSKKLDSHSPSRHVSVTVHNGQSIVVGVHSFHRRLLICQFYDLLGGTLNTDRARGLHNFNARLMSDDVCLLCVDTQLSLH